MLFRSRRCISLVVPVVSVLAHFQYRTAAVRERQVNRLLFTFIADVDLLDVHFFALVRNDKDMVLR